MKSLFTNDFEEVLEKYSDMVIRIAFTYVKNIPDAEDIAQNVFLKLYEKNPEFHSEVHRKSWLIRVTINHCNPLDEYIPDITEEENDVLSTVLSLPVKYRTVIHLFYYEEYSITEIAEILNKKPATIGS